VAALLFAVAWAVVRSTHPPDLAAMARSAGPAERAIPLPVLLVPREDVEGGNGLVCVFVARRDAGTTEITFVFADEDHPLAAIDLLYDALRVGLYGRVMDVETISYRHDPKVLAAGDPRPREIVLPGVFAGDQPFDTWLATHRSTTLASGAFESLLLRPVLRVATWNHMFAPPAPGEPAAARAWREAAPDVPVYEGTRAVVEALFEAAAEGAGR